MWVRSADGGSETDHSVAECCLFLSDKFNLKCFCQFHTIVDQQIFNITLKHIGKGKFPVENDGILIVSILEMYSIEVKLGKKIAWR